MDDEIIIAVVKRLGLEVVDGREAPLGHDPKDYIEKSYICGREIILGIFEDPERRLISFFHEVGHVLLSDEFKEKWNYSTLHLEIECWNLGIELARTDGVLFSDAALKWGYEQALGYAGHDERELVDWAWAERKKKLFVNNRP